MLEIGIVIARARGGQVESIGSSLLLSCWAGSLVSPTREPACSPLVRVLLRFDLWLVLVQLLDRGHKARQRSHELFALFAQ
jgi:hypothetical protein